MARKLNDKMAVNIEPAWVTITAEGLSLIAFLITSIEPLAWAINPPPTIIVLVFVGTIVSVAIPTRLTSNECCRKIAERYLTLPEYAPGMLRSSRVESKIRFRNVDWPDSLEA